MKRTLVIEVFYDMGRSWIVSKGELKKSGMSCKVGIHGKRRNLAEIIKTFMEVEKCEKVQLILNCCDPTHNAYDYVVEAMR